MDDGHGHQATSPAAFLTVLNAAPTAVLSGPANGVPGQLRSFTGAGTDPSSADQASLTFDWTLTRLWDGFTVNASGPAFSFTPGNIIDPSGTDTYEVSLTVTDKDGGPHTVSQNVLVSTVAVQGNDLAVGGRSTADTFDFSPGAAGAVVITVNGTVQGTFSPPGLIRVFGGNGNDTANISATGGAGLVFDGQGGSDRVTVNFGSLAGTVTVADTGITGTDGLVINGTSAADVLNKQAGFVEWKLTGDAAYREQVVFSGIDSGTGGGVTLNAGAGDDTIHDPGSDTLILGGPGNDTITIDATTGTGVEVDGGDGSDTYVVILGDLQGPVTLNDTGSTGADAVSVQDPVGGGAVVVNGGQVASGSQVITLGTSVEALSVDAGTGGQVVVASPPPIPITVAGNSDVVIDGTAGDDKILVNPGGQTGTIEVRVNGVSRGVFRPTGRLVLRGLAGNDDIQVAGSISVPMVLDGGAGDDRLKGGSGFNILLGGAGDDLLTGGNDRDVLIGGTGADRLVGQAEEDVLIAGGTAFDADDAALRAIMAEWARADRTYAQRRQALQTTGVGAGGSVVLTQATVFDDRSADLLTGSAGVDWFWANYQGGGVLDKVTDLGAAEFRDDLAFIQGP